VGKNILNASVGHQSLVGPEEMNRVRKRQIQLNVNVRWHRVSLWIIFSPHTWL